MKVLYIGRELQRKICDGGSYVSLKTGKCCWACMEKAMLLF